MALSPQANHHQSSRQSKNRDSSVSPIGVAGSMSSGASGLHLLDLPAGSGAQTLAAVATGAFAFKTLNQTGAENITAANSYSSPVVMFVAGDNAASKSRVP